MPSWSEPVKGTGSAHDFNAVDTLVAEYQRSDVVDVEDRFNGGMRAQTIHRFIRDGALVDVWGSADLDGKIRGLPAGTLTRIVYLGLEELDGDRKIKRFQVQYDTSGAVGGEQLVAAGTDDDIPF